MRIFISSVQREFTEERMALRDYLRGDALMRRFFDVFLFEDVPAADRRADDLYLGEVERCDVFIGLFGNEYGVTDAGGLLYEESFTITDPNTGREYTNTWAFSKESLERMIQENRILWKDTLPKQKEFMREMTNENKAIKSNWGVFDAQSTTVYLKNLMPEARFNNPKPINLMKYLINVVTSENDLVLDFFSGSATTADAIMQLNAEDGGSRKYIMVQLPEATDETSETQKTIFENICEFGKERIRRAGDKVKAEAGLTAQNLDIGFRVLKLDDTNMNDVYYAAGDYTQDMISMLQSNIKEDRTDMDLLFGCLLDWGLPLSLPHTHEKIEGFTVHTYNEGDLIACFEERISEHVVREIAKRQPLRVVFRDSSFTSSPEKINVVEIFKLLAPNTTVRVI